MPFILMLGLACLAQPSCNQSYRLIAAHLLAHESLQTGWRCASEFTESRPHLPACSKGCRWKRGMCNNKPESQTGNSYTLYLLYIYQQIVTSASASLLQRLLSQACPALVVSAGMLDECLSMHDAAYSQLVTCRFRNMKSTRLS